MNALVRRATNHKGRDCSFDLLNQSLLKLDKQGSEEVTLCKNSLVENQNKEIEILEGEL